VSLMTVRGRANIRFSDDPTSHYRWPHRFTTTTTTTFEEFFGKYAIFLILWLNDMNMNMNMIAIDIIYHFFGHDI
jgi:hypothetical protein